MPDNESGYQHKTVWITGASQGIGKALALALAEKGAEVIASARNQSALQDLQQQATALPGAIHPFAVDVTDKAATHKTLDAIQQQYDTIDIAILNAGTHAVTPIDHFNSDTIAQLLQLNVMGSVYGLEYLLPIMRQRRSGRIAIVSSVAGYRGLPTAAGYGASKAALINLCEALRLELHGSGVTLQVINPGFVKTPLTDQNTFDMPFLISAEEAAQSIMQGMTSNRFEIRFPRRFGWIMAALRLLPHAIYAPLVRTFTKT